MGWTPPAASCAKVGVSSTYEQEASVEEVCTIGLDIAKSVFQAHGADAAGRQLFSKRITAIKGFGVLCSTASLFSGHGSVRQLSPLGSGA